MPRRRQQPRDREVGRVVARVVAGRRDEGGDERPLDLLVGTFGDVVLDLVAALVDGVGALAEAEVALARRRHERDARRQDVGHRATLHGRVDARPRRRRPARSAERGCARRDRWSAGSRRRRLRRGAIAHPRGAKPAGRRCGSRALRPVRCRSRRTPGAGLRGGPSKAMRHGSASTVARSAPASTIAVSANAGSDATAGSTPIAATITPQG